MPEYAGGADPDGRQYGRHQRRAGDAIVRFADDREAAAGASRPVDEGESGRFPLLHREDQLCVGPGKGRICRDADGGAGDVRDGQASGNVRKFYVVRRRRRDRPFPARPPLLHDPDEARAVGGVPHELILRFAIHRGLGVHHNATRSPRFSSTMQIHSRLRLWIFAFLSQSKRF